MLNYNKFSNCFSSSIDFISCTASCGSSGGGSSSGGGCVSVRPKPHVSYPTVSVPLGGGSNGGSSGCGGSGCGGSGSGRRVRIRYSVMPKRVSEHSIVLNSILFNRKMFYLFFFSVI